MMHHGRDCEYQFAAFEIELKPFLVLKEEVAVNKQFLGLHRVYIPQKLTNSIPSVNKSNDAAVCGVDM